MTECECGISNDQVYHAVEYVVGKMYGDDPMCREAETKLLALADDPDPDSFKALMERLKSCGHHKERFNREISLEYALRLNAGIDRDFVDAELAASFKIEDYKL